jgi:hypothetical protein
MQRIRPSLLRALDIQSEENPASGEEDEENSETEAGNGDDEGAEEGEEEP